MRLVSSNGSSATDTTDPRAELGALHERLYRRQQRLIHATLGPETAEFRRYRRRYEVAVRRFSAIVPYDEVVEAATKAGIVLIGDYHTLRQAQRSTLKFVDRLLERGIKPLLALEFVQGRYQSVVDAFLNGELDEAGLLEGIHYRQLQPFEIWPNFKPLFDLALRAKLPIVAIDSPAGGPGSLKARDRYAAQAISVAMRAHPERLPVVLMGQLHLAPEHLPRALPSWASDRALTVYQNCEEIYFQLARRGAEQTTEAVRIDAHHYCLVNSSPVVAQQSYLDWVEATAVGEQVDAVTPEVHFRQSGELLAGFLQITTPRPWASVELASPGDFTLLNRVQRENPKLFRVLERRVLTGESFCLPHQSGVYLAGASFNRAAEVATRFLWHVCADEDGEPRGLVDAFYAAALEQALGFFGSKVVNPRRKAQHRPQLLARLERRETSRLDREVANAVLAHERFERGERVPEVQRLYTLRAPERFHAITRGIGHVLGDRLYYALLAGRLKKTEIRALFFDPFEDEGAALHTYLYLAGKVRNVRVPMRRG